jgi:hypothetical protein
MSSTEITESQGQPSIRVAFGGAAHGDGHSGEKPVPRWRKYLSPITLRLTNDERALLNDMSRGMPISAFIRKRLFGDDVVRRKREANTPIKGRDQIAKVLAMLGASRIANNLNQLAYHANTGSLLIDDQTLKQIEEAYAHVCSMRTALIGALGLIDKPRQ